MTLAIRRAFLPLDPALRVPPHGRGQRIGLLGGSFNPPHAGHLHVSRIALRRLKLDAIWWLVTPGNPLKDNSGLPPIEQRIAACRDLVQDRRIVPTGCEEGFGTQFTADTLSVLVRRCPGVRFVWIMGADNLAGFHRWQRWSTIAALMPIAVVDRPGSTLASSRARAATALSGFRQSENAAARLVNSRPPAWIFLHGARSDLSSTALRRRNPARSP